jgi:hypothetical protein
MVRGAELGLGLGRLDLYVLIRRKDFQVVLHGLANGILSPCEKPLSEA